MLDALIAGLFGLLIGSFLNVCIYRWTRDLSVVRPRSACPICNHMIAWYDNIPVLSFLLLGGRCRNCRAAIHWSYPAVELLTGLVYAYLIGLQGVNLAALKDCLFASILIGLIFSDLDTRLLPEEFTIGGLILGLGLACLVYLPSTLLAPDGWATSLGEAAVGALIPAGAFWLLRWFWGKIRRREVAGLGDVKMIAMMGAFLGIRDALLALTLGSLAGSIIGIVYIMIAGKDPATYELPMATFLGFGALAVLGANIGYPGWQGQLL